MSARTEARINLGPQHDRYDGTDLETLTTNLDVDFVELHHGQRLARAYVTTMSEGQVHYRDHPVALGWGNPQPTFRAEDIRVGTE